MNGNSINILKIYRYEGFWVFDDDRFDIQKEAFVLGMDNVLDYMSDELKLGEEFSITFSSSKFPKADLSLEYKNPEDDGFWYYVKELDIEGWMCPALLKYWNSPPSSIYIKFHGRVK